MTRHRL